MSNCKSNYIRATNTYVKSAMPLATRSKRSNKGFTLIELIIVVAIAAILAGMAIASYQNSVQKSRRVDAKSTLLQIAALQEKQYFQQNSYSNDLAFLYGGTVSPDDHYNLSVDTTAATTLCSVDGACFVLTATATGAQAGDASCQSFTLTNTGLQQAFDGTSNDTTDLCW